MITVCSPARADVVTLKNGDRLTASIVKSDGKDLTLRYFAGTITLPWREVDTLESTAPIHLILEDGRALLGSVTTSDGKLLIATVQAGPVTTTKTAVQTLRSQEEEAVYQADLERLRNPGLLDLWDGFLATGLSLTRGNSHNTTFDLGFSADRTTQKGRTVAHLTTLRDSTGASGVPTTTAHAIQGGLRHGIDISKKSYVFGFSEVEFDELRDLDLRFVLGGGWGYKVSNSKKSRFEVFFGGALNKEFFEMDIRRTSGEALIGEELEYNLSDIISFQQRLSLYPNLSETGNYRLNWDSSGVLKLNTWLSWEVTLSDRFLSNPITGHKKNDVLLTTGLRLSFSRE
jgi:putative salt-induced outer membrane protein YdiY